MYTYSSSNASDVKVLVIVSFFHEGGKAATALYSCSPDTYGSALCSSSLLALPRRALALVLHDDCSKHWLPEAAMAPPRFYPYFYVEDLVIVAFIALLSMLSIARFYFPNSLRDRKHVIIFSINNHDISYL